MAAPPHGPYTATNLSFP
ncbi:hypothetical protein Goarm_013733 [Gossypium armourianum]|uniref:Uncharacterized protein n=2 Tax=Gossypium TaxID=3633 RepID=A0A7J8PC72_GOSRA|nr:hypothetical protein [Gossypium raimondii]MBA0829110.1 hypothetical protein [Gossypium armourianum]